MKTKLESEKYEFIDRGKHRLEYCQDYLDIVDVLEKAKELIEREDWIYVTDLKEAVDKVFEKEEETEKTIRLNDTMIILDSQTLGEVTTITLNKDDKIKEISYKDLPLIKTIKKPEFKYYILKLTDTEMSFENLRKWYGIPKEKEDEDLSSLNRHLLQMGFSASERLRVLNAVNLFLKKLL